MVLILRPLYAAIQVPGHKKSLIVRVVDQEEPSCEAVQTSDSAIYVARGCLLWLISHLR